MDRETLTGWLKDKWSSVEFNAACHKESPWMELLTEAWSGQLGKQPERACFQQASIKALASGDKGVDYDRLYSDYR